MLSELAPEGVLDGARVDWIEIENTLDVWLWLCGLVLAQGDGGTIPADPRERFTFAHETIAPGGFLVLTRKDANHAEGDFPFGVSKDEPEHITLFDATGGVIDETSYDTGALPFDELHTWARKPDGSGQWHKTSPPTPGAAN